jgi:hypothetical protein
MTKICTACGVSPAEPEAPVPPKGIETSDAPPEPEACPNCGKEGTMEDVVETPEEDEE